MSLEVTYKGQQIAQLTEDGTMTLETAGKFCEANIDLAYSGSGGGNPTAEENDVIFIDYDGTIRYSYTAEEFAALTALPPNPVHERLTAQGWNWTLEDAQEYVRKYGVHVIGQNYITASGATEIDISTFDGLNVTVNISQSKANGVLIDFGDGSKPQRVATSGDFAVNHIYSGKGLKTILLLPDDDCTIKAISAKGLIGNSRQANACVLAARIGKNFTNFNWHTFLYNVSLKSVSLPTSYVGNGWRELNMTFGYAIALTALVFPIDRNIVLNDSAFASCNSISYISLPKATTNSAGWRAMNGNRNLKAFIAPDGMPSTSGYYLGTAWALTKLSLGTMTAVGGNDYADAFSLLKLFIPETVSSIGSNSFSNAYILDELKFAGETPPTISNANAFVNLSSLCKILVPFAFLSAYLTATNYPNPATYTYLGFATYNSGVTLPTQDSTEAYNVVWYDSKADAVAETNPITVGNGKEIYCRYAAVT